MIAGGGSSAGTGGVNQWVKPIHSLAGHIDHAAEKQPDLRTDILSP